jgi:hypothetical protein
MAGGVAPKGLCQSLAPERSIRIRNAFTPFAGDLDFELDHFAGVREGRYDGVALRVGVRESRNPHDEATVFRVGFENDAIREVRHAEEVRRRFPRPSLRLVDAHRSNPPNTDLA